jgi:predicted metalloprotease
MRWQGHGQSSNVEDRRGMRPVAVGGGIVGLIILLVGAYFGMDLRPLAQQVGGGVQMKEVGPPPDDRTKEFVKTVTYFTEQVWEDEFRKMGKRYEPPQVILFAEKVDAGRCGIAPSEVGPFYCPPERKVYLDPTFFEELEQKLGGSKAEFSQAYVIAHEVGHHVQNLLGYNDLVRSRRFEREGKNATVRLELQADYLAGVWAHHGQRRFNFIEPGDVEAALTTAKAIGDDRIQKRSRGWVSPESFTHGSAEARVRWFREGLRTGDTQRLDHFFEASLGELDPVLR